MEIAKELNTMAKWLCQRENITLVIAIAGFVMSLYNFLGLYGINGARLALVM